MPWKFIIFILICIIFAIFMAVNLENKADISFIFATISQVPVFLVVLFSFTAGVGATLLATIFSKSKKKRIDKKAGKKKVREQASEGEETLPNENRRGKKKR